jgi:hypothetical protein
MLKAMGIEDEKIDQIIEAHTETVDALKADVKKYKDNAELLPEVQRELDTLKAGNDDSWKQKHDAVKKQFDDYKTEVEGKAARAAKETAVRAYLESKGITGANLTIAMRGLGAEVDASELDGDKLKDTGALDALISGDLKGLVTTVKEVGAPNPANPPANTGTTMTRAEILKKSYQDQVKLYRENPDAYMNAMKGD